MTQMQVDAVAKQSDAFANSVKSSGKIRPLSVPKYFLTREFTQFTKTAANLEKARRAFAHLPR